MSTTTSTPSLEPQVRGFLSRGPVRLTIGYGLATLGTAILVAVLVPYRGDLTALTVGFAFLTLVVITVSIGGLWPGIVASVLCFLAFNFFFIPPYDTFRIGRGQDVVMLFASLGLSIFISILVADARARAEAAEARERELRVQQDLTRALVDPRPTEEESHELVLRTVVSRFHLDEAMLFVQPRADLSGLEESAVVRADRPPSQAEPLEERLAVNVGRRNLGLLVLKGHRAPLTQAERRILEAFSNQLALVLERDRLIRAAVEAERSPS